MDKYFVSGLNPESGTNELPMAEISGKDHEACVVVYGEDLTGLLKRTYDVLKGLNGE
ncbi:hypothetical protein LCGC14_0343600 [marine sediment metagenome]|uniref:Uncharacterized protein n=1 Tax=marine sediment metagenome TaxID=412755 RepID=A0A0F9TW40_9ZZZZ